MLDAGCLMLERSARRSSKNEAESVITNPKLIWKRDDLFFFESALSKKRARGHRR
jgi:hypothetical protein